jgi:S1-C subfamily serine protease
MFRRTAPDETGTKEVIVNVPLPVVYHPLRFAETAAIQVGEDVVAIGYAKGQKGKPSATRGIVSAVGRYFGDLSDLIQTDASINHGNSGGPLLNMRGEVVGVNTFGWRNEVRGGKSDEHTAREVDVIYGLFYARSVATAKPFVEMLIQNGSVRRPSLGVEVATVPGVLRSEVSRIYQGAYVTGYSGKSLGAALAGLRPRDIITSIRAASGEDKINPSLASEFETEADLRNALPFFEPGTIVEVSYRRFSDRDWALFRLDDSYVPDVYLFSLSNVARLTLLNVDTPVWPN